MEEWQMKPFELDGVQGFFITEEEADEFQGSTNWEIALESAGVDNWDGYDFALEIYRELNENS